MTYTPGREPRFEHITDLIEHIERSSCSLGCRVPDPKEVADPDFGPGGNCWVLAELYTEEPQDALDDDGTTITCNQRVPL